MTKSRYLLLSVFLLTSVAFGQSSIGGATLNGTVTDPTGAAIASAKVTANNASTGLTRTTATTEAGLYDFPNLPVGTYDVTIEKQGFSSVKRTGVMLAVGAVVTLDTPLQIGTTQETVSVTAETPVVETTRSATATTVTQQAVSELPVNGRNFIDFTTLTPGVVKDPVRGGDISFAGQRGTSNTLLVDGAESNNVFYGQATGRTGFRPYAFSQDAVQEFQVNAGEYPAELGRSSGGAVNVITKSGTNQFHSSAFEFYRDKGMNANSFVNNRAGLKKQAYHFNQFGGTIGGPIKKDKLFFFGSYDGQRNTSNQIITPAIVPTGAQLAAVAQYLLPYQLGLNNDVGLVKVDWNIGSNDRLSVRYNLSRYAGVNFESNSPNSAREHTGNNEVHTDNIATDYNRVLGTNKVLDLRFNFVKDNEPGLANATGPETVITNGVTFGKNNFSPRYTNARTYQPVGSLSWITGRHSIKFGIDIAIQKVDNFFPGLFAGQYVFPSYDAFLNKTPSTFTQAFSGSGTNPPISHPNVNELGFFVQDSWRITDKLTLNYGLRYDHFGFDQPPTKINVSVAGATLNNTIPTDSTDFGPRFGFAYRVFNNDRVVLRGGYGIYYSRTPGLLLSADILNNGIDVRNFTLTSGLPTYPNILTAAPSGPSAVTNINVMDPNFKSPRTQQFSLQAESALGRDFALTVGYLGVNAVHLTRTRDINLFPEVLTTGYKCPTSVACTATSAGVTPIQFYRHPGATAPARPNSSYGRISLFESGANSIYNGGFVQLTKRFSRNFQVLTSYTFSKVIDSAPDATSVVPGNAGDDTKVAQDTLAPNLERGPGIADVRHRFVFSGIWDINYGKSSSNPLWRHLGSDWQLASISQVQSGRALSVTVSGDPNNDGNNNNDRPPFFGRNTLRGPNLMTVDLRITRAISFRERLRLQLIGEAFNLTNRANFGSSTGVATGTFGIQTNLYTYSNSTGAFTPTSNFQLRQTNYDPGIGSRVLQLAAKITF
jgi:hypothetical protein